jgi:hypothetical protein
MVLLVLILLMFHNAIFSLTSSIDKVTKNISLDNNKKQNKNKKTYKTKNPTLSMRDVIYNDFKDGYVTPTFDNLKTAKNYFNNFNYNNTDSVIVSFDVNEDGAKNWFVADNRKDLYNFIKQNKNCPLYEQININKHKLYFDVDINKDDKGFKTFNFQDYKNKIEKELKNILYNKQFNFVWLNSSSQIKHSYHLIVSNLYCTNYQNNKIKDYLNEKFSSNYLDDIYTKNRCFRMWGCSKLGEIRSLKTMSKNTFCDTLVNVYSNDKVEMIFPSFFKLDEELTNIKSQSRTSFNNIVDIPENEYLENNFIEYKGNIYKRIARCRCPICPSRRKPGLGKKHKKIGCYVFKKNNKTYMGCFRAKHWQGDRYYLNLSTNEVEHIPVNLDLDSAINHYNEDKVPIRILQILYDNVYFGKYKNKQVRYLFKDKNYVAWIMRTPNFDTWKIKQQLKELIDYYKVDVPSQSTIISKQLIQPIEIEIKQKRYATIPTKTEMIEKLSKLWGIDRKIIENDSLSEIKMHYSIMKVHGCFSSVL